MKINSYFYPMIREFKDLEYGDCFVRGDIPFMKIETSEEGKARASRQNKTHYFFDIHFHHFFLLIYSPTLR